MRRADETRWYSGKHQRSKSELELIKKGMKHKKVNLFDLRNCIIFIPTSKSFREDQKDVTKEDCNRMCLWAPWHDTRGRLSVN